MIAPGPLRRQRLKAVERGEEVFQRLAVIAILLAPSWVSGINRAGTAVYLITNAVSAALWAVGIGLGAYYIGPAVLDVLADVGTVTAIGLVLLVLVGIGLEVRRRRAPHRPAAVTVTGSRPPRRRPAAGRTASPRRAGSPRAARGESRAGPCVHGLPSTNAVTLPLAPATWVRLSGWRHSSKKLPSV